MNRWMVWKTLALAFSLAACVAEGVRVERGCVTQCDRTYRDCQAALNRACDACVSALARGGSNLNCTERCGRTCQSTTCPPQSQCLERPWEVRTGAPNDMIESACNAARTQLATCGRSDELSSCAKAALFERPEVVSVYQCIAAVSCVDSHEHCNAALPVGTLGNDVDTKLRACGRSLTPEGIFAYNHWEGWLLSSASAAVRRCLAEPDCTDARECLDAFLDRAL